MSERTILLKAWLLIFFCLCFQHCADNSQGPDPYENQMGRLTLLLKATFELNISNYPVDSVEVRITGGSDSLVFQQSYNGASIELNQLPPGSNRTIEVDLYDSTGTALYACQESGVEIIGGSAQSVPIQCVAEFSLIKVVIPLGPGNPDQIVAGSFQLISSQNTYSSDLIIQGETGYFELSQVAGDAQYLVVADLKQTDSTTVYQQTSDSIFIPKGLSLSVDLLLNSVLGKMTLVLEILSVPTVTLNALTSDAALRAPDPLDMVISEFYPSPTAEDGGSDGEWLEIYNRTRDTLDLTGCRLSRTRSSGSATTNYDLDSLAIIKPGQALVLGRDSVSFRDAGYGFSLVDTKQSILLLCSPGGIETAIDSVAYTLEYAAVDSVAAATGQISSLRTDALGGPSTNENWCETSSQNTLNFTSSPGSIITSCPN